MAKVSKKVKNIQKEIDFTKIYAAKEALEILKKYISKNFNESFDISANLGVNPKHADQMVKGVCELPHGLGKTVKIAVFAKGDKAKIAKESGADLVGAEDLMKEILDGNINFDRCIATPDMMPIVGRLGKVLGPRGLMPNPKTGTVTVDIKEAIESIKAGSVEFKSEKTGIVHAGLGLMSFDTEKLYENMLAFIKKLVNVKPSGAKGSYIKSIYVSSTQGPGIKIDTKEFLN